jgi:type VI secretion system protein ImpI
MTLVVANPEALQYGCTPRHRFDRAGGTIGCQGANWLLTDRNDLIEPIHCEIGHVDDRFCVIDRSGQIRINQSDAAVGRGIIARLGEGDIIHIGSYRLTVHLHDSHEFLDGLTESSVGELLNEQDSHLLQAEDEAVPTPGPEALSLDPLLAFDGLARAPGRREDLDPLLALDAAERGTQRSANDSLDTTHYGLAPTKPQEDLADTRFEAIYGAPKTYSGETNMNHPSAESVKAQRWLTTQQSTGGDPRQLIAPLMEGLGTSLETLDEQAAYRLLMETGQALHAAIAGLTALYANDPKTDDRLSLAGRTLQPIEDNPLRLGLSYDDTMRALFSSERSVVHLSPKAAIEESLTLTRRHQAAMVQAIGSGLQALLHAFSPEVLLQRFRRYSPDQSGQPDAGAWAWQMYSHYHSELASSRQQGFEKLFWEVFEQVYDRAIRTEAQ